jgi:hypothetical protein
MANKLVQVNSGRAVHFRDEVAGILCGGSTPMNKKRIERATGLKPDLENITCKKCQEAYKKMYNEAPAQEKSFTISKNAGVVIGESQGKKPTKAQLRKWGVIK